MISFPPKGLQNALIFYFTCIIVVTSGFFAIITLSRENLAFFQDSVQSSIFLGRLLTVPARELLEGGSSHGLETIWKSRTANLQQIRATVYDANWWPKWGGPARTPPGGLPALAEFKEMTMRAGVPGQSSREIFFPIASGGLYLGALAVGVPEFSPIQSNDSVVPILLSMVVNILMGVALGMFIAQIILRPLNDLMEGLEAVKRGDLGQPIRVTAGGELQTLGEMFNLMTVSLGEKTREALERTRVLDEKVQELWEIYGLTKEMGFSLHLHQILERFLEKAQTLSFSSYGQILLIQPVGNRLEVQVETPVFPRISREEYDRYLTQCLQNIETIDGQTQNHTLLLLPLVSGRVVKGILFLAKQGRQKYSEGIRRFLETIAPLGGSLIENAQLYHHVVEMKDYIRNVLESVDSGVATMDEGGKVVTTNSPFRNLLGLSEEGLEARPLVEVLARTGDTAFVEQVSGLLAGGGIEPSDPSQAVPGSPSPGRGPEDAPSGVSFGGAPEADPSSGGSARSVVRSGVGQVTLHRDGHDAVVLQVRVHPLRAGANIIGRVLVLDDLTSLKQIERRMLESEKWAVLGRLAASVAHEIRNPLVAIRSLAEVLGEDLTGDQYRHIRVVIGEVDRLNKVVEQLLNLARPETTHLRRVSLIDLLEELLLLVRHEAHRQKVALQREWLLSAVYVRIDPEKMKQAFLNVMLNAIQAMEQGGTLTVKVRPLGDDEPFLQPSLGKEAVVVEFEDEGPGISPANMERVFEPFFTTRIHGTGLGLAITKKVLDLHQGQIAIRSQVGKGTRVFLGIPRSEPDSGVEG